MKGNYKKYVTDSISAPITMHPEEFKKDDDTKYHMEFNLLYQHPTLGLPIITSH